MKYKSFKLDDDAGINAFLAEHEHEILLEGSRFTDGMVCYMYGTKEQDVLEREYTDNLLKKTAGQLIAKVLEMDIDERMARGDALRAKKGANQEVINAAEQKVFFVRQLGYVRDIIKENENGEWHTKMVANSGSRVLEVAGE